MSVFCHNFLADFQCLKQSLPSISHVRALTALLGLRGYQLSVESRNEFTFILYCFSIVLYRTKRCSTTFQLNLSKLNGHILKLSQEEEGGNFISMVAHISREFSTRFLVNVIIMSTVTIRLAHKRLGSNSLRAVCC